METVIPEKKLIFPSIESVFEKADLAKEEAFVSSICAAITSARDEKGTVCNLRGEVYPEQVDILTTATKRAPAYTTIFSGKLGEIYFLADDPLHAEPYLKEAVSLQKINNPYMQFLQTRPILYNMLAIIKLTQHRGQEALELLHSGKTEENVSRKEFQNAGTDALLGYAYLITENPTAARTITEEALQQHARLLFPNTEIIAHELAINLKANTHITDFSTATDAYLFALFSFNERQIKNIDHELEGLFGTTVPRVTCLKTPLLEFTHLRNLYYGSYHEHDD
ncbi:MAG: hypothetical protein ABIJ21_04815 [Nanoarchaeota archaeon]